MIEEYKAQVEEQLDLFETKVERAYDVNIKKEVEVIAKKLQDMSHNIQQVLLSYITDEENIISCKKFTERIYVEIETLIIHLIETARKQEKQEAMYNVSHLHSRTLEELIDNLDELKTVCIAQARNCVEPIDNAFRKVEKMYKEKLGAFNINISQQDLTRMVYEIRRCGNEIQAIHSEHTYGIENQIFVNVEKMVKNLETVKEKGNPEDSHIKIKGGVAHSQNGKYSLSDIVSSKTEIVTDIPKRANLDPFWD